MKENAVSFENEAVSISQSGATIQAPPVLKVLPDPSADGNVVIVSNAALQRRGRKKREKLIRFIKLETAALFFLVLTLAGATNETFRKASLATTFEIAMIAAAIAVVVIPVIFFGLPRQQYRHRYYQRRHHG